MTQNEFYALTGVQVENDEFWSINDVYNNSDLDKYEFCTMWRKMNRRRVDAAKQAERDRIKRDRLIDRLQRIYGKLNHRNDCWTKDAHDVLTRPEIDIIKSVRIPIDDPCYNDVCGCVANRVYAVLRDLYGDY